MATSGFSGAGLAQTFAARHAHGVDDALIAGAQVYIDGLKEEKPEGMHGGYTSGAFFTDTSLESIKMTDPYNTSSGGRNVSVYTDVDYMMFWEEGHDNLFTRKHEQERRWEPTLHRKQEDMYLAHARAYAKAFNR